MYYKTSVSTYSTFVVKDASTYYKIIVVKCFFMKLYDEKCFYLYFLYNLHYLQFSAFL